jgi:hypothetical protein
MALGYDGGKLYILAFDHRGSFQKKMFGIEGDPDEEQTATIADAKKLIFEGMEKVLERGADPAATGVLVAEQFGRYIPDGDAETNQRPLDRLKAAGRLAARSRPQVPVRVAGPGRARPGRGVDGDSNRYDAELRPELMRRAIEQIHDHGIDVDVWKIEGVDAREDAQMLIAQTRTGKAAPPTRRSITGSSRRRRSRASSASPSGVRAGGTR